MAGLPKTYRKLVVRKLTTDFRAAVSIETADLCRPADGEICVKNRYVGVNATDVAVTKGRYFVEVKVPFDIGHEGVGEIVQVGNGVQNFEIGDAVAYFILKPNAYAEYSCMPVADVFRIPDARPEYLVLLVSGLTASIGLDKAGRIIGGETVLITAAAGGAGHIAVQWPKAAECHVIGTCSTEEKEKVLKNLGCDRVINYKKEDLGEVLVNEYPKGIDVVWETVGGRVFDVSLKNLAVKGRLIVAGETSSYKDENKEAMPNTDLATLSETLIFHSASLQGYNMLLYSECFPSYFKYLQEHVESGKIKALYDLGTEKEFIGMEGIIDAVEHLYSGKSIGKVIVKIS